MAKHAVFPETPRLLDDGVGDVQKADGLWCVTGINFQFHFIGRKAARIYKETADTFYGLGDLCKLTWCPRIRPARVA